MRENFVEWARSVLVPLSSVAPGSSCEGLAALGRMIGDATVVALSEGVHGAAEPLELRNRLLQYLAQEKGFTAIAVESGLVEGRLIHDFVRGGAGELDEAVTRGFSWTFDCLAQNSELVRWLREYNCEPRRSRPVNFYGFDMSGLPSSARQLWSHESALEEVLSFLEAVDVTAKTVFAARFAPFQDRTHFHPRTQLAAPSYGALDAASRDALTATIADVIIWLERHEAKYVAAGGVRWYAWAYRAAIAMRQLDNWLRQYPAGWAPSAAAAASHDKLPEFFAAARDVRDRAQADNLGWILEQEEPGGKLLVFAARYHLSAAPLKVSWHPHSEEQEQEVAGTYLRRRLDRQLVTVGNLIFQGEASCADYRETLGRAPAEALDSLADEIGAPLFLLDLRSAPAPIRTWLSEERQLVAGCQVLKLPVAQAFDILFCINAVTPAGDVRRPSREA